MAVFIDRGPVPTSSAILTDRGLPASIQAERTILGAMMLDAVAFNDATSKLIADDCSLDSHRRIYAVITGLVEPASLLPRTPTTPCILVIDFDQKFSCRQGRLNDRARRPNR